MRKQPAGASLVIFAFLAFVLAGCSPATYQPKMQTFIFADSFSKEDLVGSWSGVPRLVSINNNTQNLPKTYFPRVRFNFQPIRDSNAVLISSTHFYENNSGTSVGVDNREAYLGGNPRDAIWEYIGYTKLPERREYRVNGTFSKRLFVGKLFETQVNQIVSYSASGELLGSRVESYDLVYEIRLEKD